MVFHMGPNACPTVFFFFSMISKGMLWDDDWTSIELGYGYTLERSHESGKSLLHVGQFSVSYIFDYNRQHCYLYIYMFIWSCK